MLTNRAYNTYIKIAGQNVTIKDYIDRASIRGYQVKNVSKTRAKSAKDVKKEVFEKSALRATQNIFDLVACNVNKWCEFNPINGKYDGKKCRVKFLTLTFKENIQDMGKANEEFTLFNKRLSYNLYKVKKNVLKYICVPEFQKRGAVHYHVIYFNLPFIKFELLLSLWKENTEGGAYIEDVSKDKKGQSIENIAKYVAKYVNKENSKSESNFEIWKDKELLNKKRYFSSRGLYKPMTNYYLMNREYLGMVYEEIAENSFDCREYDNDYRGTILLTRYTMPESKSFELYNRLKLVDYLEQEQLGTLKTYNEVYSSVNERAEKLEFNKLIELAHITKKYSYKHMMDRNKKRKILSRELIKSGQLDKLCLLRNASRKAKLHRLNNTEDGYLVTTLVSTEECLIEEGKDVTYTRVITETKVEK
jgi:hypothetical protein